MSDANSGQMHTLIATQCVLLPWAVRNSCLCRSEGTTCLECPQGDCKSSSQNLLVWVVAHHSVLARLTPRRPSRQRGRTVSAPTSNSVLELSHEGHSKADAHGGSGKGRFSLRGFDFSYLSTKLLVSGWGRYARKGVQRQAEVRRCSGPKFGA